MSTYNPKISIYLIREHSEEIEKRTINGSVSRSAVIGRMIDRYLNVCRNRLPRFTQAEWRVIFEALEGLQTDAPGALELAWARISDKMALESLDRKHGVNGAKLYDKLKVLDRGQVVAMVDLCECYYAGDREAAERVTGAHDKVRRK